MTTKTAGYLILYGAFLIVMGLLGYLSNPEKAKTALMSGGTFGALSLVWGVLGARGVRWTLPAAVVVLLLGIILDGNSLVCCPDGMAAGQVTEIAHSRIDVRVAI